MSKYQEALDNIVKNSCPIAMQSKKSCNECKIKNTCNCKAKDWINTLQELINQTEKEHELLELYRKLSKELNLEIETDWSDDWEGIYDFETLDCQVDDLAIETFKQIEQLEEELKVKE